jgi:hypothetical protein
MVADWVDGDWTNIVIVSNAGGDNITYIGDNTLPPNDELTAANDESKLNQSKGAVSVVIDGVNARLIGKLSS